MGRRRRRKRSQWPAYLLLAAVAAAVVWTAVSFLRFATHQPRPDRTFRVPTPPGNVVAITPRR